MRIFCYLFHWTSNTDCLIFGVAVVVVVAAAACHAQYFRLCSCKFLGERGGEGGKESKEKAVNKVSETSTMSVTSMTRVTSCKKIQ